MQWEWSQESAWLVLTLALPFNLLCDNVQGLEVFFICQVCVWESSKFSHAQTWQVRVNEPVKTEGMEGSKSHSHFCFPTFSNCLPLSSYLNTWVT